MTGWHGLPQTRYLVGQHRRAEASHRCERRQRHLPTTARPPSGHRIQHAGFRRGCRRRRARRMAAPAWRGTIAHPQFASACPTWTGQPPRNWCATRSASVPAPRWPGTASPAWSRSIPSIAGHVRHRRKTALPTSALDLSRASCCCLVSRQCAAAQESGVDAGLGGSDKARPNAAIASLRCLLTVKTAPDWYAATALPGLLPGRPQTRRSFEHRPHPGLKWRPGSFVIQLNSNSSDGNCARHG